MAAALCDEIFQNGYYGPENLLSCIAERRWVATPLLKYTVLGEFAGLGGKCLVENIEQNKSGFIEGRYYKDGSHPFGMNSGRHG